MSTKKEIQRLKELGHSQREVSKRLQIDRRTIQRYWDSPSPESPREEPGWVDSIDWDHVRERRKLNMFATAIYEETAVHPSPQLRHVRPVPGKNGKKRSHRRKSRHPKG